MNRKDQEKLQVWQERLTLAENAIAGERERMLRREQQYEGGHTIYAPDGTKARESLASHVRNVSFEIIETQVDSTIPSPKRDGGAGGGRVAGGRDRGHAAGCDGPAALGAHERRGRETEPGAGRLRLAGGLAGQRQREGLAG